MTRDIGPSKGRVDFEPQSFDRLVREKGYRVLWQSAELCPCRLNDDTEQSDPSCTVCDASGYVYTMPDPTSPELIDYTREDPPFLSTDEARATQAVMSSFTHDPQIFEKLGEWLTGTAALTTFSWNRLGHRDRFKVLDHTQVYRQVMRVPESLIIPVKRANAQSLRYPVVNLRRVFGVNGDTTTDYTEAATINDDGSLTVTAPAGTRISVSYEYNPLWVVIDYPHILRGSLIRFKTKKVLGNNEVLPIQAMVRLDYLVSEGRAL